MTDKQKYQDNIVFNIHYMVRDILTTKQVKQLKEFCEEQLEERELTEGIGLWENKYIMNKLYGKFK